MFGGAGVLAQTAVFEIGIWVLLLRPSVATLIGAECGILTSFILNNRFSFAKHHHPVIHRLLRYHLVVSGSLFIQWLSVFVAESLTHNIWIIHGAYMVGIIVGFFFNYTGYRLFVWHPKQ
jgi:putative flippase GtrA